MFPIDSSRIASGFACAAVWLTFHPSLCRGDDWPQILGPERNGAAVRGQLGDRLPASPDVAWRHRVGQGFAGPAVAGPHVFIFHRVDDFERLEAVDRKTGRLAWRIDFLARYSGGFNPDQGPRCVPLVEQGKVIVFGAAGVAHAVDAVSGKKLWTRDLYAEYSANDGYFGAGSSPIAVGDRVLLNVGGRAGAGIVALSLHDGKTLWTGTDEGASYASPIVMQRKGQPQVVFVTRFNTVGIDPADGRVQFRIPFGKRGPTVNAANPLVFDNQLFLTASYGIGARLFDLGGDQPQRVWSNDTSMSSQYNTPVFRQGKLYGIHGREDLGQAELRCIEARTGRVAWAKPRFGVASLLLAGDKLLALTGDGELVLIRAEPNGYREISRVQVSPNTTRALPALCDGQIFFRDNNGDEGELSCLTLHDSGR